MRKTVAIVGASNDRGKFGNKSLRAHAQAGYETYAVNPRADEVEGRPCHAKIGDVPVVRLDRVSMYVPPFVGLTLLPEIAAKGCEELWLNPGTESDELIKEAQRLGLNVVMGCSIVDLGLSPRDFP